MFYSVAPRSAVLLLAMFATLGAGCGAADGAGPFDAAAADVAPPDATEDSQNDAGVDSAVISDAVDASGDAADLGPDIPVKLPGSIEGVEPEAHAHHPPMIDGNGNLYRVTESSAADGNQPRMMKSSDGGATWSEVDKANRPAAKDLEGCWQLQHGPAIHLSVAASSRVWWTSFHTSDAADQPDRWVRDEQVETALGNDGGVVQFSSMARTPDGQIWTFYSDTMVSGRQQIGYRRRSAAGTWSSKQRIGDTSGSWTGPTAISGAGGVTHVFYKDHLNHRLLHRTLSPSGVLSTEKRIDAAGTSSERLPHTNAVHFDNAGAEVVVIAYANKAGQLRAIPIVNGVAGAEESVSTAAVLQNPDVAKNDGVVAHLALDGTTVHALWTDLATGDIKHAFRALGTSWSTPTTAWSSGSNVAWWVYGNVYVRGGRRRLGFTYDVGVHADDVGDIKYNEITLDP